MVDNFQERVYRVTPEEKKKTSLIKRIRQGILFRIEFFVIFFPEGYLGTQIRKKYWKWRFKTGENPFIRFGAKIVGEGLVEIGSNFRLEVYSEINAGPDEISHVFIGNDVGIGRGSFIVNANHRIDSLDESIMSQGHESRIVKFKGREYGIVIENDVWLGANVVVLTGTYIGTGSVVGANSVVSGIIPSFSIVMGNPGRIIGNRLKMADKSAPEAKVNK
jgi:acetyltransferase-like isoleucine patch superfamily enzyme